MWTAWPSRNRIKNENHTHQNQFWLGALALAGGLSAPAQSNNTVPGDTDYARFSQFISDRNIFDPSREPRTRMTSTRTSAPDTHPDRRAPYFTLVGTMSYEKGMFAFFDSNNSDMKKGAGRPTMKSVFYKVKEITPPT